MCSLVAVRRLLCGRVRYVLCVVGQLGLHRNNVALAGVPRAENTKVTVTMVLAGITLEEFETPAVQNAFLQSVSATMGVPVEDLVIIAVAATSRRLVTTPALRAGRHLASALDVQVGVKRAVSTAQLDKLATPAFVTSFKDTSGIELTGVQVQDIQGETVAETKGSGLTTVELVLIIVGGVVLIAVVVLVIVLVKLRGNASTPAATPSKGGADAGSVEMRAVERAASSTQAVASVGRNTKGGSNSRKRRASTRVGKRVPSAKKRGQVDAPDVVVHANPMAGSTVEDWD